MDYHTNAEKPKEAIAALHHQVVARAARTKKNFSQYKRNQQLEKRSLLKWSKDNTDILDYLTALLDDGFNTLRFYSKADQQADLRTLENRIRNEGPAFATKTLPALSSSLLNYIETGVSHYPGFKLQSGTEYPAFLRGIFSVIYNVDRTECTDDAVQAFRFIYQLGSAFKKFRGPYASKVLRKNLADFVAVDEEIGKINISSSHLTHILQHAQAIVTRIFKDFDVDNDPDVKPRPGPGATNTPVEKHMRYEPHVLYEQIEGCMPMLEWFFIPHLGYDAFKARVFRKLVKTRVRRPTSRYKQIDKTAGKCRGICIEENEMQFMQQALKNGLYAWLENHPETAGRINFSDQSVNGRMALLASMSRLFATIDMSEASDRILRILIAFLFANLPRLRDCLLALSTQRIDLIPEHGYRYMEANKYAPMGSALCFPVMAIAHFSLCKAIILESNIEDRMNLSKQLYVYGDDIILPSQCAQAVFDWLPQFGPKLNQSKSYVQGYFRESCGLHAYRGMEVTPVYVKYIPNSSSGADVLLSALATEYGLYKRGFYSTAKLLRQRITFYYGSLPYVNVKSSIAGFQRDDANDLAHIKSYAVKKRKYNDRTRCPIGTTPLRKFGASYLPDWREECVTNGYQSFEYRLRVIRQKINSPDESLMKETSRYMFKLCTGTKEAMIPTSAPDQHEIVWRWVLDSALTTALDQTSDVAKTIGRKTGC